MPPKVPVMLVDEDGRIVGNSVAIATAHLDDITGAISVIDVQHHEIHEGEMFTFSDSASILNGNSRDLRLTVGENGAHFSAFVSAGGSVQIYLYEAPTISGGTPVASYNMNRISANTTSPLVPLHTPSVSATGSVALVNGQLIPGGNSPTTRVGGGARTGAEWILKPNTEYLLRLTNVSGGTIVVSSLAEYYSS